jgi:hypothetical protein
MLLRDKLNALRWSKKYRADYDRYREYNRQHGVQDSFVDDGSPIPVYNVVSEEGRKLCARFRLPYPYSPYDDEMPESIRSELDVPAVIMYNIPGTNAEVAVSGSRLSFMIEVDTEQSQTMITKAFTRLYRKMKEIASIPERAGRDKRGKTLNHWEIYALRKQGKSKMQIMRVKFPAVTGTPAYDPKADECYKQVTRALKKADALIREFEQDR